jgi:putative chitinase
LDADRYPAATQAGQQSDAARVDLFALLQIASSDPVLWTPPMQSAAARFEIDASSLRLKMFVAQCAHESRRFTQLVESMHYSAPRLLDVFRTRFTPAEATDFAYDDVRIAERVYGGRMGNGPEGTGDGYLFRARGPIGITGRAMYRECGNAIGIDLEGAPQLLELPAHGAMSAGWFWQEHGCNEFADSGDFGAVTRAINGGMNGYDDRLAWLDKLRAVA